MTEITQIAILKTSGSYLYKTFIKVLLTLGFKQSHTDPCVLVKHIDNRHLILGIYVDDVIVLHRSKCDLEWLLKSLSKHFAFTHDGELSLALGIWRLDATKMAPTQSANKDT